MKLQLVAPPTLALISTLGFAVPPAAAAAPANDTYAGRTAIGAVPFSVTQDTTEATTDADDAALNAECGAPAMDASVWYEYTATEEGGLVADVSASDYSAGVFVATGSPGAWEIHDCAPGAASWYAEPGVTYSILVIDDQEDGEGNGGTMQLNVDVAPPPPNIDIEVDPTASFTRSGDVVLTGTVTCDDGAFAEFEAGVTQTVGRLKINGWGWDAVECDGTSQPWSLTVTSDNGVFRGGKAATVTFAYACGAFDCGEDYAEHTVMLNGRKR